MNNKLLALSGGIGGAKLVQGLAQVLAAGELAVIANTGDDLVHLGLYISPDVDTLLYTLAQINNTEMGWGRAGETWSCMTALEALGGETWFRLGDKDLALHLYRTARLKEGRALSEVTEELRVRLQIGTRVLPMSDEAVRTRVETDNGLMDFQHYFVRERCAPEVKAIHYAGARDARPSAGFSELLHDESLNAIIICPSNPWLSIGPILAIPAVRQSIRDARAPAIAISPIIEGQSLKGPTAKLMAELGVPVSAAAVAEHYSNLIDGFVLDRKDERLAGTIEQTGVRCLVTNTIMNNLDDRIQLARDVLSFARTFEV